jgi:hypothetical protein
VLPGAEVDVTVLADFGAPADGAATAQEEVNLVGGRCHRLTVQMAGVGQRRQKTAVQLAPLVADVRLFYSKWMDFCII